MQPGVAGYVKLVYIVVAAVSLYIDYKVILFINLCNLLHQPKRLRHSSLVQEGALAALGGA